MPQLLQSSNIDTNHTLSSTEAKVAKSKPRTSGKAICGQMRRPRCDRTGGQQGAAEGTGVTNEGHWQDIGGGTEKQPLCDWPRRLGA
jgi:hypothetical protein